MNESQSVAASPSVRRLARALGVNIEKIAAAKPLQQITEQDIRNFQGTPASTAASNNSGIPNVQQPNWADYGDTSTAPMSRIQKVSAKHLHAAWLNVPHVTHFDEADITELEAYRQQIKTKAKEIGVSMTPLVFMLKAASLALKAYPRFNCALDSDGKNLTQRHYYHIGIAVETESGLMVPVVRDVEQKSLFQLAKELGEISLRARSGKLKADELQGGCFSISSLGSIGGTQFTPIVNSPEVGILGLARAQQKIVPDATAKTDKPGQIKIASRLMQPLAVSYDHKVVDGACAARFTAHLAYLLTDVRQLMLPNTGQQQ